ncbi:MAG: tRNA lysidine(34) synthetase TilS [Flavobacteriales bacterium]|nr:tRNA lysidine(34) synthetase TilS [Flavobacteriales bacterium]
MFLVEKVQKFIATNRLAEPESRILIGLSGGLDSVVLCHVMHSLNFVVVAAHVNFKLRGTESDVDAKEVSAWSHQMGWEFVFTEFETSEISLQRGTGIQETARQLRYDWFEEMRVQMKCAAIAVAHHTDDQAETILFHLFRGSGIKGLSGMQPKRGNIIRPLLQSRRADLEEYLKKHGLAFREDSSNKSEKYKRNLIRRSLIPKIEEINQNSVEHIVQTGFLSAQYLSIAEDFLAYWKSKNLVQKGSEIHIPVKSLSQITYAETILWMILEPLGFSTGSMPDILNLLEAQTGKQVAAEKFLIMRDREVLIIGPIKEMFSLSVQINQLPFESLELGILMEECDIPVDLKTLDPYTAILNLDELKFPLIIRTWREGDQIVPLGMKGRQKISDLLIQSKVPLHKKQDVCVLESNGDIAWVAGYKVSDLFRIKSDTPRAMCISMKPSR